ncbi:MAG: lactate racemase domain-containing protein [Thermoanaerobaculaceae bacterium]|nr:lactate racemase domain-containing protein [Thermoanaerobaculaceae bacterium]
MILRLRYGREHLTADLRGLRCQELKPTAPRIVLSLRELVESALDRPAAGPPLAALARGRRSCTILVPDATRSASLPEVLPLVLERLAAAGVPAAAITVLVACGTHPPVPEAEARALVGPLPEGVTLVQHDARDEAVLRPAGVLSTGLTVRLHRALLDADLVIAVSKVQHHYFAGFGGGPKLVFPGVAGYDEIQRNHARVLDLAATPPCRHPGCEPGNLAGNPVAEEIALAAALRPPDFAVLLVDAEEGTPAWSAGGPLAACFPAACDRARAMFEVAGGPFDRIVVSAGGAPRDHTLIQAHKALDAACRFASPGAEVVFLAACAGGAGSPAMDPFLADPRPERILALLAEHYVQYGQTALRLVEKTARFRVTAISDLPVELQTRLGMTPARDLVAILDRWRDEAPGATVAVFPGPPVYPSHPPTQG